MKKIIAVLMSVILLMGALVPTAFAKAKCDCGNLPLIMISGFGATTLKKQEADGTLTESFPPAMDDIKALLTDNLEKLLTDKPLLNYVGSIVGGILEPARVNPDGTSYYNMVPYPCGAENTSLEAFTRQGNLAYVPYTGSVFLDMESIGDRIGDDHVFNFTYDWRLSHIAVAAQLQAYIEDVMAMTGHDKVNIYSMSQGCLVAGAYLYDYADYGYVNHIVFDTPVLAGTSLVTDAYTDGQVHLNFPVIATLLTQLLHMELDLAPLFELLDREGIHNIVDLGAKEVVVPPVSTCVAFWDMLPNEKLAYMIDTYLDPVENAAVIAQTTAMHNGFMSHITETFENAEAHGATVYVKATSGYPMASGSYVNSDSIVDMEYSCGAVTAPFGEQFPADYEQAKDIGIYSISPDRTMDLSTGFWPQRTWVMNGVIHGQVEWDENSLALVEAMLFTDDIVDAYSHYEFPQFMESITPDSGVQMHFKSTNGSFLAVENGKFTDKALVIQNLSKTMPLVVNGIEFAEGTLTCTAKFPMVLKPGASVEVGIKGTVPAGNAYDNATVSYILPSLNGISQTKTFGITITSDYPGVTNHDFRPPWLINIMTTIKQIFSLLENLF